MLLILLYWKAHAEEQISLFVSIAVLDPHIPDRVMIGKNVTVIISMHLAPDYAPKEVQFCYMHNGSMDLPVDWVEMKGFAPRGDGWAEVAVEFNDDIVMHKASSMIANSSHGHVHYDLEMDNHYVFLKIHMVAMASMESQISKLTAHDVLPSSFRTSNANFHKFENATRKKKDPRVEAVLQLLQQRKHQLSWKFLLIYAVVSSTFLLLVLSFTILLLFFCIRSWDIKREATFTRSRPANPGHRPIESSLFTPHSASRNTFALHSLDDTSTIVPLIFLRFRSTYMLLSSQNIFCPVQDSVYEPGKCENFLSTHSKHSSSHYNTLFRVNEVEESEIAHVALYEKTISLHPRFPSLDGCQLLEVGCGQGGGIDWINRSHSEITSITGMDRVAIRDSIITGDAHDLPFTSSSFDIIINVESSHLYGDPQSFFNECARVLSTGGHLCWADLRYDGEEKQVLKQAEKAGFKLIRIEEITDSVIRGMEKVAARYDHILLTAPWYIKLFGNSFRETYCAPGTKAHERYVKKEKRYWTACWMHRSRKSSKKHLRPIHTKIHTTKIYPQQSAVIDPSGFLFIHPTTIAEKSKLLFEKEEQGESIRPVILNCLKMKTDRLLHLRNGLPTRRHRTVQEKEVLKKVAQTSTFFEATLIRIQEIDDEISKIEKERAAEKSK
ncbi:hypothetical protein PRIPAC_96745 [Pristionchus pacificus]|uniref:Methyltransferase n=1 Tax=Pristionchus pacificus TaxID=54126 RepID=A0A2A6CUZ7_PRIPA|nr:hypothetical protein PRIPAC_96745 [Pristionchus pacificus]|eukprot:PDM81867.1 methyltransferase [Pristionchus pacificus]